MILQGVVTFGFWMRSVRRKQRFKAYKFDATTHFRRVSFPSIGRLLTEKHSELNYNVVPFYHKTTHDKTMPVTGLQQFFWSNTMRLL